MSSSPFQPLGPAHYVPLDPELPQVLSPRKRVGVFSATREGHTLRVAERITSDLLALGFDVDLVPVGRTIPFPLGKYSAAILAASVHEGSHEKEMVRFVKSHRADLERMITAFLSVSLSEAGAERQNATPNEHLQFVHDVDGMLFKFFEQTQWHPTMTKPVAGALLYTHYNFILKLIMQRIARKAGAETDTSRDYIYTDWKGLDRFADEFSAAIRESHAPSGEVAHAG